VERAGELLQRPTPDANAGAAETSTIEA